MINRDKLIQAFRDIVGWPYASPGSNSQKGIDCSGAFVRAYKVQGQSIYHGSNTIYRKYCSKTGAVDKVSALLPGMAVFKRRTDGAEPGKYQGDGVGNMYHIGLVCSVDPLQIIHATTPIAKLDTKLGNWSHWGLLSAVDYEATEEEGNIVNTRNTIRKGAKGAAVTELQGLLLRAGYELPRFGADGSYGSETVETVKDFQQDHGLTVDGICGMKTWAALDSLVADPEGDTLYSVTITGMSYNQAWDLAEEYGGMVSAG